MTIQELAAIATLFGLWLVVFLRVHKWIAKGGGKTR